MTPAALRGALPEVEPDPREVGNGTGLGPVVNVNIVEEPSLHEQHHAAKGTPSSSTISTSTSRTETPLDSTAG